VPLDAATVASYDAALIATDHDVIAYMALVGAAKLVVDTRRACARAGAVGANVVKARQETGRSRLSGRSRWSGRK
jgi:UDP-N-acetyl-D-glucosamine dehydrogenase